MLKQVSGSSPFQISIYLTDLATKKTRKSQMDDFVVHSVYACHVICTNHQQRDTPPFLSEDSSQILAMKKNLK